ncbi:MAG: cyclic nucleotide-binding domain-containing protein [Myxococcota bacterium]|jgi:CRP-like cAMP-binding protein
MEVTAGALKRFPLFSTVPDDKLGQVVPLIKVLHYRTGKHIFEEGTEGDKLFLVSDGSVRISKFIDGVGEEALSVLKPGAYFGEMSIIDSGPRSATALAHTDCEVWEISRDEFIRILQSDRDLSFHVLWNLLTTLSHRLRETNEKIKAFFAMSTGF